MFIILWLFSSVRATTSVHANFLSILQEKPYFFYFTYPLLQNTHISLSILHIYLIKYSFFLHFLLFPSLSSLAQTHHIVFSIHTHTQPATLQQNPATNSPIFHNNNDTITITTTLTHSPFMSDQFSVTFSVSKRIVGSERLIGFPNSLTAQTRRSDSIRGTRDLRRAIVVFVFKAWDFEEEGEANQLCRVEMRERESCDEMRKRELRWELDVVERRN